MVKERPGYKTLGLQIPEVLHECLHRDSEESGVSASKVLAEILRAHYRVSKDELPKPRKSGRKPKRKPPPV